eukprot:GHVR01121217.1.p1 GENE.GHVR01121217.1~~GHVR01121217.1.p1  ORF type:complete len:181 (+),score=51.02 GHVR01121217.1:44-544(+)
MSQNSSGCRVCGCIRGCVCGCVCNIKGSCNAKCICECNINYYLSNNIRSCILIEYFCPLWRKAASGLIYPYNKDKINIIAFQQCVDVFVRVDRSACGYLIPSEQIVALRILGVNINNIPSIDLLHSHCYISDFIFQFHNTVYFIIKSNIHTHTHTHTRCSGRKVKN